jgi:phytanoyl-CoA dioxygenase PhyH
MTGLANLGSVLKKNGFAMVEGVLSSQIVNELLIALTSIDDTESVRKRGGIFAVRNLLDVSPAIRKLTNSILLRQLVEPVLGEDFFPVRGILFDKIADANWKVPWHQDVTIAVQERVEVENFGPWSIKAGVLHVQPPSAILENMVSVRLHLDSCGEENGALRVLPGSHCYGRFSEAQIPIMRKQTSEFLCSIDIGGALLMRPLLLHASSASRVQRHRRVVHLDFASVQLPNGMRWFSEAS